MLHILLTILKILGILLLVLVGILLVIILSVLFVPVCYDAQGKKTADELYGKAAVSWLFRLVYARFVYEDGKTALEIFLFGIPLLAAKRRLDAWKVERRKRKAEKPDKKPVVKAVEPDRKSVVKAVETDKKPTVKAIAPDKEPAAEVVEPDGKPTVQTGEQEKKTVFKQIVGKVAGIWKKIKGFFAVLWRLPGKIADRIRKIRLTFRGICDKIKQWYTFFQMDDTREAIRFLKEKGKGLLRHILPRKVRGKVMFGFDDPSLTGQVLALAGAVYPLYKDRLQITPVFDRQVLEGEVKLSGRVFGGYLLWQAWQIYRNREVKVTYRRFQHKEA